MPESLVGRNTYPVMMHHVAVFMLIKGIFYFRGQRAKWHA